MNDFIFKSRFSNRRHDILKGCRKPKWVDPNDECDVEISEVEPDAAPVSYKIFSVGKPHESHEVRSYVGSLWSPIYSASDTMRGSIERRAFKEAIGGIADAGAPSGPTRRAGTTARSASGSTETCLRERR